MRFSGLLLRDINFDKIGLENLTEISSLTNEVYSSKRFIYEINTKVINQRFFGFMLHMLTQKDFQVML
jgi:hypothetical protein